MTDPISHLSRSSGHLNVDNDKAKPKKVESESQPKVQPQGKDEVLLSEITEKSLAKAEFDEAKVNEIKAAIQEGKYPIDSKKIAESFLALEKMIGGKLSHTKNRISSKPQYFIAAFLMLLLSPEGYLSYGKFY